jgi:hypothetical protein
MRAQARAASHPACPAPTTTMSYRICIYADTLVLF